MQHHEQHNAARQHQSRNPELHIRKDGFECLCWSHKGHLIVSHRNLLLRSFTLAITQVTLEFAVETVKLFAKTFHLKPYCQPHLHLL